MRMFFLLVVCIVAMVSPRGHSQCVNAMGWSLPGVNGDVYAMAKLPNGDLVVGGWFTSAGGVAVSNIALWNGNLSPVTTGWSAMGGGMDREVTALTVLPNGDLVAGGGMFRTAGGVSVYAIAKWDGSSWSPLGEMFAGNVFIAALAVLPNGDLIAAGAFNFNGMNFIARWDGTSWSRLGTGMDNWVHALAVLPNGDLIAAGDFHSPANRIARWNGTTWTALGEGFTCCGAVRSLAVLPNGDLVAAGDFRFAGDTPVNGIARWNGASWSAMGTGINGYVNALAVLPNGDLIAGGWFTTAGGVPANRIAR